VSIHSAWDKVSYIDRATGKSVPGESFFRGLHRVTSMFIQRAPYEDLVALSRESNPTPFILQSDTGQNITTPTASGTYNRFWKMYTPYVPSGGNSHLETKYRQGVANPADKKRIDAVLGFLEALYYQRAPAASPESIRTTRVGMRTTLRHVLTEVRDRREELIIERRDTVGRMQNRPVLELLKNDAIDASWEEAWLTLWASLHDLAPIVFGCSYNFGFPVYLMESGINFNDLVNSDLGDGGAVDLGASLLTLIQKGAAKGLVMADCKPANLTVVTREGKMQVRYIDFGSDFATLVRVSTSDSVDDPSETYFGTVPFKCAELLTLVVFCAGVYARRGLLPQSAYIVYRLCADRLLSLHSNLSRTGKPDGMPYTLCGLLNQLSYRNAKNYVESTDAFGRDWRMFVKTNIQDVASTILAMAKWYGGIAERDLGQKGRSNEIIKDDDLQMDKPLLPQIVMAIKRKTMDKDHLR
jgi:hypothetical protein